MTITFATIQDQVEALYVGYFGRAGDPSGVSYWVQQINAGMSLPQVAASFSVQDESKAKYPYLAFPGVDDAAHTNATAFVTQVYQDLFNRAPDSGGLAYWVGQLTSNPSPTTVSIFILNVVAGAQDTTGGDLDVTTLQNKLTVADYFTNKLAADGKPYNSSADTTAHTIVAATTSDSTTVTTQEAIVDTYVASAPSNTGTTFALSTGADTIAGTNANDTITGIVDGVTTTNSTLNFGDNIKGGSGTDSLDITYNHATADATNGALISGVEVFDIRETTATGTAVTLDASKVSGLTAVNSNLGTGDVVVTNLASGAAAGLIGNGALANGTLSFSYAAAGGAAGTATLNLSSGVVGTNSAVTLNQSAGSGNETTLVVNSTGAANAIKGLDLQGGGAAAVTQLTINAASNLDLGTGASNFAGAAATITVAGAATTVNLGTGSISAAVKTVDASGMTSGGITALLNDTAPSGFVLKGGQGNDHITYDGTAFTNAPTNGAIDAGAGTADVLVLSTNALTLATGKYFANFEVLQNNTGAAQDMSFVSGVTTVSAGGNGSGFTNMTAGQAGAVTIAADDDSATFALASAVGSSDVLNVTLQSQSSDAPGTTENLTNATVDGFETVKITDNATSASSVSFASADSVKTITLSGTTSTTIDILNTTATLTSVDASTMSGSAALTLTDSTGGHALNAGLAITGSGNADSVTLGATSADTITSGTVTVSLGTGNDTLKLWAAELFTGGSGSVTAVGGTGTDTLVIQDAGATLDNNDFAHVSGFEKLDFSGDGNVSLTGGANFQSAFGASGVTVTTSGEATVTDTTTVDLSTFTGAATVTTGFAAQTGAISLTGGSGVNTLTVSDSAGTAAASVVISAGGGNDVISVKDTGAAAADFAVQVTGGTGADTITLNVTDTSAAQSYVKLIVAAGDSPAVSGSFDVVTGFYAGAGATRVADTIDFAGGIVPAGAQTNVAVTGHTVADLNYSVGTDGVLSFAGASAATMTAATVISFMNSQLAGSLNNHETVEWYDSVNGNTYVFNNNTGGKSVVELVGVHGTALDAGGATATAGHIAIA